MISPAATARYNQKCVKSPAQTAAAAPEGAAAGPPGFSDSFRAFDEEFDYVCRSLRRHGVRPGDAEDLAQDVLMVAWRRWGDYDRRRPLRPWLAGIAARVARDSLKRRWREVPHGYVDAVDPALVGEDQVELMRTHGLVAAALAALPDRHRKAIVLHDLQGLAPHEIARAMGVPMATAYTRLRRAHLALAREVARARKGHGLARPPDRRREFAAGVGAALLVALAVYGGLQAALLTL